MASETDPKKPTLIHELRELKELVDETATGLRTQRDVLKMRGMSLPPMVMQAISGVKGDISKLETLIVNEQTELAQLRSLADTSAMTNSSLDSDFVLSQAMDVVIGLTDAERGYIILLDEETSELEFRVSSENELTLLHQEAGTPEISTTIVNEVMTTGQPLLADNAYKDERYQDGQSIAAMTLRSVLCVPLNYRGQVIGVVYCDNRLRAGVFEEREKSLLAAFANQASVAIQNARLYENIQQSLVEIGEIKELMDNVFASIGSGVVTMDASHKITQFNKAASEILEHSVEEVIGKSLSGVLPDVSIDLDNYLAEIRQQDADQVIDAEFETATRGRIAVNMKLSALKDDANAVHGVAMVVDDVTAQLAQEQTFRFLRTLLPPQMVDNIHDIARIDLGGERREVTCMFVDVRPVSTFPTDFRPQQIMEQLNEYFSKATDCIHDAEGVIDKYMGNEIMALFNTQLNPMEDHAQRAVQAALQIREAFIAFYAELGINPDPHFYRVGMHTGVATLGNVGSHRRKEFSAIGNTINMSKRFEENAERGQIILSPACRDHILETLNGQTLPFRLEELEPIQLKGIQNKVPIYEVFKS